MTSPGDGRYLTTAEVARRLDVKPDTVYAYVSRGLLHSVRGRGGSKFDQAEVDRLVAQGRAGHRPSGAVERIRTELTLLDHDELYYRGRRVVDLAKTHTLESVAQLLWTGDEIRWPAVDPASSAALRDVFTALPSTARLTDLLRVGVTALALRDPLRFDVSEPAVLRAVPALLTALAAGLSGQHEGGLAALLAPALSVGAETIPVAILDAALVLLADHGLATSTAAVRIAASARANIYSALSAGLAAADGATHGAHATLAYRFLARAADDPLGAVSERLRVGERIPGFGHAVYRRRDPRFAALRELLPAHPVLETIDVIGDFLAADRRLFANIDLALAALTHIYGLRPDAGETIFEFARLVGWTAHVLEEYREPGVRFRVLGDYTGLRP